MIDPDNDVDQDKTVELDETIEICVPVDLNETLDEVIPQNTDESEDYDTIDPEDGVQPVRKSEDPFETWDEKS